MDQLTPAQVERVQKRYATETRKPKNVNLTIEDCLARMQKEAITYLIVAICAVPIYICILVWVYPMLLAGANS